MTKTPAIMLILISLLTIVQGQTAGDKLYDNSYLHKINFEAKELDDILLWNIGVYESPVKMTIDEHILDSVFLRRKGYTSNEFNEINPPFKIDLDYFVLKQDYDGIDKFNLHNHHLDTFYQRNALAYSLYRRAGVPAPRTAFAEVYINGKFIDIYTITEDIDKTFLKNNFTSNKGSLYKGLQFSINSVNVQEGEITAYDNFINNINAENFEEIIDAHNFFRVIAVDLIINDNDSYALGSHNYYMYQEPKSEKLHLITWDHNFSFKLNATNNSLFTKRPPIAEIIASPVGKKLYIETFCNLLGYLIDEPYFESLAMSNYAILSSNMNNINIPTPTPIIDFIAEQKQRFLKALATENYNNCNVLDTPIGKGDIVINEFVAKSDENGVKDPNGGTPDWIELYNTTNKDILLDDNFYLSNSLQFLKKWHFEEETIIPANGYLIIWADKDIHQEGIHSNFKLEASGGNLFLTFENMTLLQQIRYDEQISNLGYARYPNGSGEFRIQAHTFDSNNEYASFNIESNNNAQITIYPNPTKGKIFIKNHSLYSDGILTVINSMVV